MKKVFLMCMVFAVAMIAMAMGEGKGDCKHAKGKSVEISFDYVKQKGPGSNQFAVWIENEKSEVVKTLFVTSFTTKGRIREGQPRRRGYTYRPACVPTWVKNAKAAEMSDQQIDGFTGATPQTGRMTFNWDFTDDKGKKVGKKGKYRVCVEATLKNEYQMLFTGLVSPKDKCGEVTMKQEVRGSDEAYSGMIKSVKAVVKH